jgi:hypothetical protein
LLGAPGELLDNWSDEIRADVGLVREFVELILLLSEIVP